MKPGYGPDGICGRDGCHTRDRLVLIGSLFLILAILVLLPRPGSGEASGNDTITRVNCGGDTLVDIFGNEYRTDRAWGEGYGYGYLAGAPWTTWHTIGGTKDTRPYETARNNYEMYRFALPDGDYWVTLRMTDYHSHMVGQYEQSIWIQGHLELDHLDIFERVERDYALGYRFPATVTDGLLDITAFQHPRTQISVIEVQPTTPDTDAPTAPVLQQAIGSFKAVVLDWFDNTENDLAGYEIRRWPVPFGATILLNDEPSLVSRYIDFAASTDTIYSYEISAVDVFGNASHPLTGVEARPLPHEDTQITLIEVVVDSTDLELINEDPYADVYVPATVTVNDTTYTDVEIRYRGDVVRALSKKSFKVRFSSNDPFRGLAHKFNLIAEFPDRTLLRESAGYHLFRTNGVPAPDAEYAHVTLNDFYLGTYLMVEHVDERFLENHNLEENTLVYKCYDRLVLLPDTAAYKEAYTKETMEDGESWGDIISLIEMLNLTPQQAIYDSLARVFDIENYIHYHGLQILMGSFDWIYKNYFLAHDLEKDIWQIWPWDLDLSFGLGSLWDTTEVVSTNPLYGTSNMLFARMMEVSALKNLHFCNLERMTETGFAASLMEERFQEQYETILFDAERDWRKRGWEENRWLYEGVDRLTAFVEGRNSFLQGFLPPQYEPQELYINELMAANLTSIPDEFGEYDDWIELYNSGQDTVFLDGYYLTDEPADPYEWAFPDTFIAPYGFLLVWADDDTLQGPLHASFKLSRNGEIVALHRMEAAVQAIDVVIFGPQGDDYSWSRRKDGECPFDLTDQPTPGESNDLSSSSPQGSVELVPSLRVWPNPVSGAVRVELILPGGGPVVARVYDVRGRRVREVHKGPLPPGKQTWIWDGRDDDGRTVPQGMYWIRTWTSSGPLFHKVVRIR